jgi:SAM-dependent methyltransferase
MIRQSTATIGVCSIVAKYQNGAHGTMSQTGSLQPPHTPSAWVERFAGQVPTASRVLDVACGAGRHTRLFLDRGNSVTAIDRDLSRLNDICSERLLRIEVDLETGTSWPLGGERFAGVIVTNYLYRPMLQDLVASVASGGLLIYETFAQGNEQFGKPINPNFLLRPGELLNLVHGTLQVIAYENITVTQPKLARIQRICAYREPT